MTTTTLACHRCGAAHAPGTRFCSSCGTDVSGARPAAGADAATAVLEKDEILPILMEATLGDYDIYGMLGKGGMATVYLALDLALNRKVAIKVMHPQMLMGDDAIARFRREAQTAANLQHPNVIPIYAVKQTPKIVFFVMKYIEGRPLDSIIKDVGPLPVEMATGILSQVCSALHYAHKRGIVHRDIKPANIMIDEDGNAIVTDFGIAKVSEAKGLTMTGATVGTPAYMSPEQYEGKNIAGGADQYSLGVVAYEMLTGHTPFGGDSIMTIMKGHLMEAPPPIATERGDLPPQLAATVMRMLEKRIDDRFADLAAVSAALDAKVLPDHHPARTQLIELAKTGAMLRPRMSVPLSPIPPGKRPASSAPTVEAAIATEPAAKPASAPAPAPRSAPRSALRSAPAKASGGVGVIAAAALALAAVGGGAWYFTSGRPPVVAETVQAPAGAPVAPVAQAPQAPQAPAESAAAPAPPVEVPVETPPPPAPAAGPVPTPDKATSRRAAEERRAKLAAAELEQKRIADERRRAEEDAARLRQAQAEKDRLAQFARAKGTPSAVDRVRAAAGATAPAVTPNNADPAPEPKADSPRSDGGAAGTMGTLKIASSVDDAALEIDGVGKGTVGMAPRNVPVKAGTINWVVRKAGCVAAEGTVKIEAGQTTVVGRNKASPVCP
ncbi:MAG: protein kinase domain-containing protein [Gemmatimonadota bacterium]